MRNIPMLPIITQIAPNNTTPLIHPKHNGVSLQFQIIRHWDGNFTVNMPALDMNPQVKQWLGLAFQVISQQLLQVAEE